MIFFGRLIKVIKSWLSKLLPNDEYKEKNILYFLAESAVIFCMILIFVIILSITGIFNKNIPIEVFGLFSLWFFCVYIFLRYVFSGIEYTEIFTEADYKKEKNLLLKNNLLFLFLLIIGFTFFNGITSTFFEFVIDLVMPCIFIALIKYVMELISLRWSYKKNKRIE
jgi:hypothetical protein